jgi:predicted  nucleic acid-binding Zn-ribbon protein
MKNYTIIKVNENGNEVEKLKVTYVEFGVPIEKIYQEDRIDITIENIERQITRFEQELGVVPREQRYLGRIKALTNEISKCNDRIEELEDIKAKFIELKS